jgi:hypothetical protein
LVIVIAVLIGRVTAPAAAPPPTATVQPTAAATVTPTPTVSSPSPPDTEQEIALETPPGWAPQPTVQVGQPTPTVQPGSLFFRTAGGVLVAPQLPAAAGTPLPTKQYRDVQDHYSLSYPADWHMQAGTTQGHGRRTLFPPGVNPTVNVPGGAPALVFGWSATAPAFDAHDSAFTDLGTVTAGGIKGRLFTIGGPMGYVVTASFPDTGGYLILSADAENSLLIAAFQQTLASLRFVS